MKLKKKTYNTVDFLPFKIVYISWIDAAINTLLLSLGKSSLASRGKLTGGYYNIIKK